jgi:hypothetical protein
LFSPRIIAEIARTEEREPAIHHLPRVILLLALAAAAPPNVARPHEVPSDVTVRVLVKPERERVRLLVRVPLEAMQDITFPTVRQGFLDTPRATPRLRDAAEVWLVDNLELYEGERRLPLALVNVRASLPSDRSFSSYDSALAHLRGPPLPAGLELPWRQALLDAELEAPIESASSLFSLRARTERFGMRVVNAVRFIGANGAERVYRIEGDSGLVALDPRWHQAMLRFLVQGFEHILDGADHLLFLLCLVVPFRRRLRALVWIVTAFTAGHSLTLIGSAYGLAPAGFWFPPLVETLIALSIVYMAVENVVSPNPRSRWPIAFGFGLVHGFGFSFALTNTLQFAGDHVLMSLLSFNVGIELGQLLVLLVLVPALNVLLRFVDARVGGIVIAVIAGHTAWHWLGERLAALAVLLPGLPWAD